MSVTTGTFVVRRGGQVVDARANWSLGPAISSADVSGADASVTWRRDVPVASVGTDYTTDVLDGQDVTVDWVDDQGEVRVFTGTVDSTTGQTLGEWTSRLSDGTRDRLSRVLDLRPTAWTLPVHHALAGAGGRARHVGLFGVWFTHQAMTQAGYDPGVPMHWSAGWYQSMCGSVATVPGRFHAWAPLGDLRQAHRLSDPDAAPGFTQGDTQIVAYDVFSFGVTSRPRPGTESLPWQLTVDMGLRDVGAYGSTGEVLLRNLATSAGVALAWTPSTVTVQRHTAAGARTTVLTASRAGEDRWSLSVTGTTVRLRSNLGYDQSATASGVALPTGASGLCTVRVQSPGVIGPVAVTRGDRTHMVAQPPTGVLRRGTMTGTSLPGWLNMPDQQAGRVLTDQADSHRGLRGQPLWSWIDPDGVLHNIDFDTLAAQAPSMTFDVRPGPGGLALDDLAWHTDPPGGPWSAVEVRALGSRVLRRDQPTLLMTDEPSRHALTDGEEWELFLQPRQGEAWLEPDLRPRMAGFPYPSPPYPASYKHDLQRAVGTWLGGSRTDAQSGDSRGWLTPAQMGWQVNSAGHVTGALEMLTPDRVLVKGTVSLPTGQDATTMPNEGSSGLSMRRRSQALPQLRGYGLVRTEDVAVTVPIDGVDDRHGPFVHDVGMWVQSATGLTRIASHLHDALTRPTPVRTARVQTTGRVRPGMKVSLVERRPDGVVVTEEVVVARVSGSTVSADDSMTLEGVVTHRAAVQTDPDGPPVDEQDDWSTQPPTLTPDPPRDTDPPDDEDEPGQDPAPTTPPVRPAAPTVTAELNMLVVRWAGLDVNGDDALGPEYGTTEVAIAAGPAPDEVVGWMESDPAGGQVLTYGPVALDSAWWVRIRTVDRWGTSSAWSDAVAVTVDPLVDPAQFEDALGRILDAEEGLDELAAELAAGGHALPDPEFEDPAEWTVPAGSTWRDDLGDHPFHRLTGLGVPSGASTVASTDLPAQEGQRWWVAVLVRADAASTSSTLGGLRVEWTLPSHRAAVDVDVRPLQDFPVGEWVLLSGYAVAPADTSAVRLTVRRTSSLAPPWTLGSARLLRASGGIADPVVLAGFGQFLRINVGQLVVTESATINEAVILRLAAELAEFVEVEAEHIRAGTIEVLLDLAAQGGITAGSLNTGGRAFMRGGAGGGVGFEVPDAAGSGEPVTVARMGRDWISRNSAGDITASILGEEGSVGAEVGDFSVLRVGGQDVGEAIRERAQLVVHEDTGIVLRGPYTTETGYRTWGFAAKGGHVYRVECTAHVIAPSDEGGTHFTYLRQTQAGGGVDALPVTISTPDWASDDASISAGAEGRFRMYYYYVAPGDRAVRVGLSARKGGTQGAGWRFARAVFTVTDEGLYQPLVTGGRWDLMGATGAPAPDPAPPPQRYQRWYDFDWHDVYQQAGPVDRQASGVGGNLRQGRVGSTANFPFATLLRVPDAMRTALMGSTTPRVWIQLTSAYRGGPVIVGQATTATSSPPSSFPTPISPTAVGTITQGATRLLELPSAWVSRWVAGTNRSLTLGRLDSAGASDQLIDFRGLTSTASVRARLYAEWEK